MIRYSWMARLKACGLAAVALGRIASGIPARSGAKISAMESTNVREVFQQQTSSSFDTVVNGNFVHCHRRRFRMFLESKSKGQNGKSFLCLVHLTCV